MREIEGERLIIGRPFSRPTTMMEAYQPSINYWALTMKRYDARADLRAEGDVVCWGVKGGEDVRAGVVMGKGFV